MNARSKARWILAVAMGLAAAALASDRSSTNYSLSSETFDAGGGASTSPNYGNTGSLGGWSGVSTAASSSLVVKHGFVGQLYERVGLKVTAASESVDEGLTKQFRAEVRLDDATFLAIENTNVVWSVDFGPLAVDSNGLATADVVLRDRVTSVRAALGSLEGSVLLRILNSDPDNFGAFAGDGIDDSLQTGPFAVRPFLNIVLTKLPSGDFYFELEGSEWILLYSEDLELDSWKEVSADAFFIAEGNGWRLKKDALPAAWFLKGRLKQ